MSVNFEFVWINIVDTERLKTDLLALGLLALVVFVGLSFLSYDPADPPSSLVFPVRQAPTNICGEVGAAVAFHSRQLMGFGVWIVLATLISWDLKLFSREQARRTAPTLMGIFLLVVSSCALLHLFAPGISSGSTYGSGGQIGAWTGLVLQKKFSAIGVMIFAGSLAAAGILLTPLSDILQPALRLAALPASAIRGAGSMFQRAPVKVRSPKETAKPGKAPVESPATIPFVAPVPVAPVAEAADEAEPVSAAEDGRSIRINPPAALSLHNPEGLAVSERRGFSLPDITLLKESEEFPYELLAKKARVAATTLEKAFEEFGLNVKVAEIDTGPVVTQFELELERGLRLNKVTALEDDLAIALRVPSVRVVAPIPGKNTVGVEVPNDKQVMVRMRELLQVSRSTWDDLRLPLFLGKDVSGRPLVVDMAKMPHLLIAGRTGTGKSVCLNTLILSLLMTRTPDEVRMLMIDPKMVELSPYKKIPHLMHPVITDMKKAEAVLAWAVDKMEERYDLLARVGVRHLDSYNKLGKPEILERLGLKETDPDAAAAHIIRLAQKSRAVGIHLVLATQKPTVDVITGLIKSNLPARISFQVASKMDSRVVLDEGGAERLLGSGDMLYLAPSTSYLTRAQGTYVSDEEINAVIDFFSDVEPEYSPELTKLTSAASAAAAGGGGSGEGGNRIHDDLYDQAVEVVIREGRGSVSLLQRALGIGYGRAARMIDYMAEDGVVGDYNGAQAREVICSIDEWESRKAERDD